MICSIYLYDKHAFRCGKVSYVITYNMLSQELYTQGLFANISPLYLLGQCWILPILSRKVL